MNQPVPPPEQSELPKWSKDPRAKAEEKNWPNEETLNGQKAENDRMWLKVYGYLVVGVAIVFTVLFVLSVLSWAIHHIAPESWNWLNPDQLSKIQSIIFSGSLGAIVSSVFKNKIEK